jgi:opacity protein-like surface antigen
MKKLLISAVIIGLSSSTAYAAAGGLYLGGQLGYGNTGYDIHHAFIPTYVLGTSTTDISHVPNSSVSATGLAGRVYTGMQFNANLAAEVGYSLFSNANSNSGGAFKSNISTQAFDVSGKLIYPVNNAFNIYAKGGAALVRASQDITGTTSAGLTSISSNTDPVRPRFGGGGAFYFTPSLALDTSWTRIQGNNNIQNLDIYGAGLTYYFG